MITIFGDSLTFFGPKGGLPSDNIEIWPNKLSKYIKQTSSLYAKIGWTMRDVWWAITSDPNIWRDIAKSEYIIIAVGSMDSMPSAVPSYIRESIKFIRPVSLRRIFRKLYKTIQPKTSGFIWPQALPPKLTKFYLNKIVKSISVLNPKVKIILSLPSVHNAKFYNGKHPARLRTLNQIKSFAIENDLSYLDIGEIVKKHILDTDNNPDGMHWSFKIHENVAKGYANLLTDVK